MNVPIMGFRKLVPIHVLVNGIFRCDYREGQVMVYPIFIDDLPALVDAGLVG